MGNLSNLKSLGLSGNPLTGNIPPELGNLPNLQELGLSSNQLTGAIPPELGELSNLQQLILSFNQLTGSIPPELGKLSNLQDIGLHSNQLTGNIPPELGNLSNLLYLYLYSNQLTGSIPSKLGNLSNLQILDLSSNQLTGNIPPELGNLSNLLYLYLYSNQLTGSIPSELGDLPKLRYLNLASNQLAGRIPLSFTKLTALQTFGAMNTWLCEPHDADFQAWKATVADWSSPGLCYSISGQVTRSGSPWKSVTISDGGVHATQSGADGAYTLADLPPGSYTLTPSLADYTFTPTSRSATLADADLTGQDFSATLITYSISGAITQGGNPLAGVIVSDGKGHSAVTGANGAYTLTGLVPGNYTLTPAKTNRLFTPTSRSVTLTNVTLTGQNFSATSNFKLYLPILRR